MTTMKQPKQSKHNTTTLRQLCDLIPKTLVNQLAQKHGVDKKVRTFCEWSHVVSLLFAQMTHSIGLNDVCDALRHHASKLKAIKNAVFPNRNTLSHANKERNSDMMEELFWSTLKHLQTLHAGFGLAGRYNGLPRRFKRTIHAIDSSTIELVANCMDWAKHRRRKAAAKLHMRLDMSSFLPAFAIIEEGKHHDNTRMAVLIAGLKAGEIAVFDKAYIVYKHLFEMTGRGVFWVSRAKENMSYKCCKKRIKKRQGNILRDEEIILLKDGARADYPERMRLVEAEVEIDGKLKRMIFLTNNFEWAASSVCELYRSRWGIEVFFKQIKQTLKVCDFLGHSKHAIRWQMWSALLLYVLLRFLAWRHKWSHSFMRLLTILRGVIWDRFWLKEILEFYGTACGSFRMCGHPEQAYFPGFQPELCGTA